MGTITFQPDETTSEHATFHVIAELLFYVAWKLMLLGARSFQKGL